MRSGPWFNPGGSRSENADNDCSQKCKNEPYRQKLHSSHDGASVLVPAISLARPGGQSKRNILRLPL
jgi:hypothetical protein